MTEENPLAEVEHLLEESTQYSDELSEALKKVEQYLLKMDDEHEGATNKIVDHFNVLAIELDNRKNDMLQQLDKLKDAKIGRLQAQQQELDQASEEVRTHTMQTRHAMDDGHQDDTLTFAAKLKEVPRLRTPITIVETSQFTCTLERTADAAAVEKFGYLEVNPRVTGTVFPYKSDFDRNGILYWIGCNYGTSDYQNPADIGLVTVDASSCEYGSPNNAVSHECIAAKHKTFMSKSEPNSWLQFHLGVQYVVCPSAYTIKNCVINSCHSLSSWEFQGSMDGHNWVTLKKHVEDVGLLPSRGSSCTWLIDDCKQFFNRFRLLMTGPNQYAQPHARFYYLMLSSMELYGFVEMNQELLNGAG